MLRAQRDRFWPLKVIKEHLLEHGVDSEVTSIASRPGPTSTLQAVRLDRRGLAREAGVEEEFLLELEQFGMLAEGSLFYGATEVEIVTSAPDLADEGLHPRHLVMLRTAGRAGSAHDPLRGAAAFTLGRFGGARGSRGFRSRPG